MKNLSRIDPCGLYRVGSIARRKSKKGEIKTEDIQQPLFDMSASSWWAGVKDGRFPKPVRLGKRMTCWRGSDLLALGQSENSAQE